MKKLMMLMLAASVLAATDDVQAASVKYDRDSSVAIAAMEDWAWKWTPSADESLAEARIRRTLAAGFVAKGYSEVDRREADFVVEYHAAVGRELSVNDLGGPGRRNLRVDTRAKGVLVVDVVDRRTGRLVWRGSVTDYLADDPAEADRKAERAIEKLLEKFPARDA
jgi:hypothetical protein